MYDVGLVLFVTLVTLVNFLGGFLAQLRGRPVADLMLLMNLANKRLSGCSYQQAYPSLNVRGRNSIFKLGWEAFTDGRSDLSRAKWVRMCVLDLGRGSSADRDVEIGPSVREPQTQDVQTLEADVKRSRLYEHRVEAKRRAIW
ncbi:uncharacterized protein BDZ83DRAFT_656545 [Colletotrichum acutatum]|uniref:Uncharacterized protein n=1 Tax=Glomerella acutata TaxID=27357 RepID=A0AAD8UCT3_GLOAC|nr:uncharacterized protein BDZ83DRAFT_656545 [Colletotrichum acutatum]KAK1712557.1 hypothetical protein BDZ83DRAFT_656545 [Colletotrichum acutatum]